MFPFFTVLFGLLLQSTPRCHRQNFGPEPRGYVHVCAKYNGWSAQVALVASNYTQFGALFPLRCTFHGSCLFLWRSTSKKMKKYWMHNSSNILYFLFIFCRSVDICGRKEIETWVNSSSTPWLTFHGTETQRLKIFWEFIGTWPNKEKSWNIWQSIPRKILLLCGIIGNANVLFGRNTCRLLLDTLHLRIHQPRNFGGNRIVRYKLLFGPCPRLV